MPLGTWTQTEGVHGTITMVIFSITSIGIIMIKSQSCFYCCCSYYCNYYCYYIDWAAGSLPDDGREWKDRPSKHAGLQPNIQCLGFRGAGFGGLGLGFLA